MCCGKVKVVRVTEGGSGQVDRCLSGWDQHPVGKVFLVSIYIWWWSENIFMCKVQDYICGTPSLDRNFLKYKC